MTTDSPRTEQGQGQEVHTMNMNNIQQVIDSCSDENWKDIMNNTRLKSLLDKSIQSIEITLDMSGLYSRGVNSEKISLEYFNEGFKCRFNPSSEGNVYGHGMVRFTLRINFLGKLGTNGSEKSDSQYNSTIENVIPDTKEILHHGFQQYKETKVGYALSDQSFQICASTVHEKLAKDTFELQPQLLHNRAPFSVGSSEILKHCLPTIPREGSYVCFQISNDLRGIIAPKHKLNDVKEHTQWVLSVLGSKNVMDS